MPKATEIMRVGLPIRALKLKALLETLEPSMEATVRHHDRQLIVEEPDPQIAGTATDGND